MKRIFTKLMAALVAVSLCLSLVACNPAPDGDPTTFVSIDINPSLELTLDKGGVVATVYGANEDGQILLYGEEENILGKNYEEAVAYITTLAAELGYIEEGHEISATVTSDNEALANSIKDKLKTKITATAEGLGISVTVSGELAYSLLRELEALKERYPDNTAIQNLTPGKYKMVVSASEGGDISITAAAEMSNEELIGKINEAHSRIEKHATEAYKAAKAKAEMLYELAMGVALDGVYNTVYLQRMASILSHPEYRNTFYYGAVYQAYKTTARALGSLSDIIEFGNEMANYELDGEAVAAIAAELGIDDTTALENEEGRITLRSVIAYVDDFIRENEVDDEVEERIEEILDAAEDAAEMAALASDEYHSDLASLKTQVEGIVGTINATAGTVLPFLGEDAKAELEACLADLDDTVVKIGEMMADGITEDELEALIEDAEDKAEAMLVKIKADLTEEELERVEALKAEAEDTIARLRTEFSDRLAAAEASAKAYIESRREERRGNKGGKGN